MSGMVTLTVDWNGSNIVGKIEYFQKKESDLHVILLV